MSTELAPQMNIEQFDFSVDLLKAILWEYNDATNLQSLLTQKAGWYNENQQLFWENWYDDVFNLATANQFGLIVWGIILGLPLYVNTDPNEEAPFGFDNPAFGNFDNSNFAGGGTYVLPLETQRIALQLRYFQLTSAGTVPEINRMLKYVFKNLGDAWLLDYHNMNQLYIFNFPVTSDLVYLFNNYDILPRPAGVGSGYYDNTIPYWGFSDANVNFDNGGFGA